MQLKPVKTKSKNLEQKIKYYSLKWTIIHCWEEFRILDKQSKHKSESVWLVYMLPSTWKESVKSSAQMNAWIPKRQRVLLRPVGSPLQGMHTIHSLTQWKKPHTDGVNMQTPHWVAFSPTKMQTSELLVDIIMISQLFFCFPVVPPLAQCHLVL